MAIAVDHLKALRELVYMSVPDEDGWLTTSNIRDRTFGLDDECSHAVTFALLQKLEADDFIHRDGNSWQRTDEDFE